VVLELIRTRIKKTMGERFVTVEPEIKTHPITKDTEFLIIASDGVWAKLTSEEAIDIVRKKIEELKTKGNFYSVAKDKIVFDLCMDVVREADARQSSDNISCIVVVFNHIVPTTSGDPEGKSSESKEEEKVKPKKKKANLIRSPRKSAREHARESPASSSSPPPERKSSDEELKKEEEKPKKKINVTSPRKSRDRGKDQGGSTPPKKRF